MQKIKKIHSLVGTILLCLVLGIGAAMMIFPDASATLFGYRMFTILSDSMEPDIPVDSLVIIRSLRSGEQPLQDDVITFEADRFGQVITLTHIYDKSEIVNGITYYRTHPLGTSTYDPYDVPYENIKGIYVFHVPYIGKFMMFIGSPYGVCLLIVSAFILFLYQYMNEHFDLDDEINFMDTRYLRKNHKDEAILVRNLSFLQKNGSMFVSGELLNATSINITFVKAKLIFLNENTVIYTKIVFLVNNERLDVQEHRKWTIELAYDERVSDVCIEILGAKRMLSKKRRLLGK